MSKQQSLSEVLGTRVSTHKFYRDTMQPITAFFTHQTYKKKKTDSSCLGQEVSQKWVESRFAMRRSACWHSDVCSLCFIYMLAIFHHDTEGKTRGKSTSYISRRCWVISSVKVSHPIIILVLYELSNKINLFLSSAISIFFFNLLV